jgi:hypothetical protein
MINENTYRSSFSPTLPQIQEEKTAIYYSHKSKRNKKRYKRNLKRVQRSYFKFITEEKLYDTDEFLDQLYEWEMI